MLRRRKNRRKRKRKEKEKRSFAPAVSGCSHREMATTPWRHKLARAFRMMLRGWSGMFACYALRGTVAGRARFRAQLAGVAKRLAALDVDDAGVRSAEQFGEPAAGRALRYFS